MRPYFKYFLIFISCVVLSVGLFYLRENRIDRKEKLPNICGENEDSSALYSLSINHVWESRGKVSKTLNEGDGTSHYEEWRFSDGEKFRYIREEYPRWGGAHEALASRLKGAKNVCQRGRIGDNGYYVDAESEQTRVIASFNDGRAFSVEIIKALECDGEDQCSLLVVYQAPSLIHALAMERAFNRVSF